MKYNTVERNLKEGLKLLKERNEGIDSLIYVKMRFRNEDIICHILKKERNK